MWVANLDTNSLDADAYCAAYIIQTINPIYLRMRALYTIATEYAYRRELISGAFGHHLVDGR